MSVEVKICGLSTPAGISAAVFGGARYVGFIFYSASPRFVTPERAAALAALVPSTVLKVGVVVDIGDADLAAILERVRLDMLQLHGHEPPERVAEIRERFGLPVIKAAPIYVADDIARARRFEAVADRLLFDAKAPSGASRPGGNAISFNWSLLKDFDCPVPWFLAGGVTAANVADAVRRSGAKALDISSGVETAPGVKSAERIRQFLKAARAADAQGAMQ
ncbi:MAG: phosphoribosylanthranilate isomerase [Rhodospirillales bacterium]|jgi:phosphoribosylanthranilate isomerase|nr:phosphoribosylanthranilate isomerase [Rhodospirillales bacterium]